MKKHTSLLLFLPVVTLMWGQLNAQNADDIDLSGVVVIEDAANPTVDSAVESDNVVEIPEPEIEGARLDVVAPVIPVANQTLPGDTEIVLEIPGQGAQAAGTATMEAGETISVDFPDEDVRTILRNVADLFDLNLVIPETLQGRTSIKLRNITWREVFEVVLEPFGYTYVEDRNIIRIRSMEELTMEPVDTRVFVVNFARAMELQGSITPLVDAAAGGQIRVDVRSNALVITERPSRMNKIQEIIERLDRPTDQVMIETKFIEVTNSDIKNIGVNWASLSGYELSASDMSRQWTRGRSNTSTNTQTSTVGEDRESGRDTEFSDTQAQFVTGLVETATENSSNSITDSLTRLASTGRIDTAVFSAAQFNVILSALKTDNNSKLVANPTVVTMNNQAANISIVTEIPQVEFSFNAETGSREADGLAEPLIFGTQIEVTPQVNAAGFINLKVVPSVSNQIGLIDTQVGPQPIISRREANTNVVIKDGFTLAIGGLSQNEETKSGSKVPLLGDLPGLGRFFSSKSSDVEQRNLIIFITAKTLNPDGTTYRDIIDPRVLDGMGIVPSEVPGYDIPQSELELLRKLEEIRSEEDNLENFGELGARIKRHEYLKMQAEEEAASRR